MFSKTFFSVTEQHIDCFPVVSKRCVRCKNRKKHLFLSSRACRIAPFFSSRARCITSSLQEPLLTLHRLHSVVAVLVAVFGVFGEDGAACEEFDGVVFLHGHSGVRFPMTTRITPGVGANLLGQHAAKRNQDATAYVGNLDSQVVRKVDYNTKGVRVTTKDGSVYTTEFAILSLSLGVLESELIDFVPDLPFWKLKALYTFDMAVYMKIFLKFLSRFWDTNRGTKFWLYADERRGYFPISENLDSEFPGENVLIVTVMNEEARRIELQSDGETLVEIMAVLCMNQDFSFLCRFRFVL